MGMKRENVSLSYWRVVSTVIFDVGILGVELSIVLGM